MGNRTTRNTKKKIELLGTLKKISACSHFYISVNKGVTERFIKVL